MWVTPPGWQEVVWAVENSSYFECLEAKAKERYREQLFCVGLSIQDNSYLLPNDARLVNDMATWPQIHSFRWEHLASATKMVVSCRVYGCNNRFGERHRLGFYRFPAVPKARRKKWIQAHQNTRDYVATILYQVSLQQVIATTRIQLCAVAIKSFLHWHWEFCWAIKSFLHWVLLFCTVVPSGSPVDGRNHCFSAGKGHLG